MDFTPGPSPAPRRVMVGSPESLGIILGAMAIDHGAQGWATANLARYVPMTLARPMNLRKFFWAMNTTANVDVGIYTSTGTRIVSSGTTVGSGAATYQEFDVTDTILAPGRYYLAGAMDNGAGQAGGFSLSTQVCRALGVYQEAAAFPLPATATFAVPTSAIIHSVGVLVDAPA